MKVNRPPSEADATHETFERGQRVVRRLYRGEATAAPDGWQHLRTVVRVQTETVDCATGKLLRTAEHYFLKKLYTCSAIG